MCKRIFKFELQLSSYWQNIKFSRYWPKFHIFTNIVICENKYICNFLDQLLHPYKLYGRDMLGILFFIFASCEPLTQNAILASNLGCPRRAYEHHNSYYSPEKWLHNWIATGPNKSKNLTRLTSPAHTTHGKVRINPLEIWVVMQRASKQRSSRCHHAKSWPVVQFNGWTQLSVCVYPSWPPCIAIISTMVDWFTFSATCHSWHGLWSHVCCFSFKLCRVYCVSAI